MRHTEPRRLVLYSHDTMGLGHTRRNLLIAQALSESRTQPATLMVFGAGEAQAWDLPTGVESLTLPAVRKAPNGGYASRRMPVSFEALIRIRSQAIAGSIAAFDPDLVIVDKVPGGLAGELLPTLRQLRRRGRARLVLGLREVLDDPAAVRAEWAREDNYRITRECYDAIWVYGDRRVADDPEALGFGPELRERMHYTGYLDPLARNRRHPADHPALAGLDGRIALCLVGGGQDGAPLARAFAAAPMPAGTTGVVVAGPQMPDPEYQAVLAAAADRPDLRVLRFVPDADALIARADRVVAMGGYNTTIEILAHERPALIVPRTTPRTEQLIRAERLAALGLIEVARPNEAGPERIGRWLASGTTPTAPARRRLDFGGLNRVSLLARALTRPVRRTRPAPRSHLVAVAG